MKLINVFGSTQTTANKYITICVLGVVSVFITSCIITIFSMIRNFFKPVEVVKNDFTNLLISYYGLPLIFWILIGISIIIMSCGFVLHGFNFFNINNTNIEKSKYKNYNRYIKK